MSLRKTFGLAAVLAIAAVVGVASAEEEGFRFLGKVKNAADGATFDVTDKRGTFRIEPKKEVVRAHKLVKVKDCPAKKGFILARYQAPQRDPQTGMTMPGTYVQVGAIVVSDAYKPPELSKDQLDKKLAWTEGTLKFESPFLKLGEFIVQAGPERFVVVIEPAADLGAIKKGMPIFVRGPAPDAEKKVVPTQVDLFDPKTPPAELQAILGS